MGTWISGITNLTSGVEVAWVKKKALAVLTGLLIALAGLGIHSPVKGQPADLAGDSSQSGGESSTDPQDVEATAEPEAKLERFQCNSNYLYAQSNADGTLWELTADDYTIVRSKTFPGGGKSPNALAIDGFRQFAFSVNSNKEVKRLDLKRLMPYWETIASEGIPSNQSVFAGAYDVVDNRYWFGGPMKNSQEVAFYFIDLDDATPMVQKAFSFTSSINKAPKSYLNGDIAFGLDGTLYILLGTKTVGEIQGKAEIRKIPMPISETGIEITEPELVATIKTDKNYNGIAFDADGFLHISASTHGGEITKISPSTGRTYEPKNPSKRIYFYDLASCNYPPTLTIRKDVVERADQSDEYALFSATGDTRTGQAQTYGGLLGIRDRHGEFIDRVLISAGEEIEIGEAIVRNGEVNPLAIRDYIRKYQCSINASHWIRGDLPEDGRFKIVVPEHLEDGSEILCTLSNEGTLSPRYWKTVSPQGVAHIGDELTYDIYLVNDGPGRGPVSVKDDFSGVLDDGELISIPAIAQDSASGATISDLGESSFVLSAILAPGETAHATYKVRVTGNPTGNLTLTNKIGAPVSENWDCETEGIECVTTLVAIPQITKTVSASDGKLGAGSVLTYTLTIENSGTGEAALDYVDDFSRVVDDAVVGEPSVSLDSVAVSRNVDAFAITGSLPAGETVTITYQATVKPDGQRGDNLADNFVIPAGQTPPSECVQGSETCTSTPIPELKAVKSVTREPGRAGVLVAGEKISYTLSFDNSAGKAAARVDYADYLTGVLDDADVNATSISAQPGLTAVIDGRVITVGGEVPAGEALTVSYQVVVKADGERGDSVLDNVLAPSDNPDPDCADDDVSCTRTPVEGGKVSKSVVSTDSELSAGSVLNYKISIKNTGGTQLALDYVDDFSRVADDAVVGEPSVSLDSVAVTRDGDTFTITGSLPAGQTVTITYQATVKPDGQRGDNVADNFVVPAGQTPPSACVQGSETCTSTPIPSPDPGPKPDTNPLPDPKLPSTGPTGAIGISATAALVALIGGALVAGNHRRSRTR